MRYFGACMSRSNLHAVVVWAMGPCSAQAHVVQDEGDLIPSSLTSAALLKIVYLERRQMRI